MIINLYERMNHQDAILGVWKGVIMCKRVYHQDAIL